MYTLRDRLGRFICQIDSSEYDRKVILRNNTGREIGYGQEETHALRVGTIQLYLDDHTYIGKLERELGMGGSPNCVLCSGPDCNERIPVDEFGNPYIIRVLFGHDVKSYDSGERISDHTTYTIPHDVITVYGDVDDSDSESTGFYIDDEVFNKVMVVLGLICIVASAFLRGLALRYESSVIQILTLAVPGFFGVILFLICLFHRHGGLGVRLAGLIESICTAVVMGVVLRIALMDEKKPVTELTDQAVNLLPHSGSFLSGLLGVVIGLACIFLFFFLLFLFFVLLAVAYRAAAGLVKTEEQKKWIKNMNLQYHLIVFAVSVVLTISEIVLYTDGSVFTLILLGLFSGLFAVAAFALCERICGSILDG